MRRLAALALLAVATLAPAAQAQPDPRSIQLAWIATPPQPGAIPLYPGVAPGSEHATQQERWGFLMGGRMVHNVTAPTLTPFFPDRGHANGAAVIVAPGGAFMALSMDNEGYNVARMLASYGITAFVLKYRLDPTPDDAVGFLAAMGARFGAAARAGERHAPPITNPLAVQDGLQAVRLVRRQAARFHVDPGRIGFIGFSAGAITALQVALTTDSTARPTVAAMIYGPMSRVAVPSAAPPLFAALAIDDPLMARTDYGLLTAWHQAGRPAELHLFESGNHGFGLGAPGTTASHWPAEFLWFLQEQKFLPAPAVNKTSSGVSWSLQP